MGKLYYIANISLRYNGTDISLSKEKTAHYTVPQHRDIYRRYYSAACLQAILFLPFLSGTCSPSTWDYSHLYSLSFYQHQQQYNQV
jgi:hypothetical protein